MIITLHCSIKFRFFADAEIFEASIFEITMSNTNDDPTIITNDILKCKEDSPYFNDYEAKDVDPTNIHRRRGMHSSRAYNR